MSEIIEGFARQPFTYFVAVALTLGFLRDSIYRLHELRFAFAAIVFATIGMWYLIDPVYRPEGYRGIATSDLFDAYLQVCIFLVAFRFVLPIVTPNTPSRVLAAFDPRLLSNQHIATVMVVAWIALFTFGISRMKFDVITALLPLKSRAAGSLQLFARPRVGSSTDFIVSALGYLYEFVCAAFGVIAVGTRNPRLRNWMLFMMLLTWPSFVVGGARHKIISVGMPTVLAVLALKKWTRKQQITFLVVCFLIVNTLMLAVIRFRNSGFDLSFDAENTGTVASSTKHLGLNMTEELIYINRYQQKGDMEIEWGNNYFANAVNIVPRSIWPGKPDVALTYAMLRVGRYRGDVAATISNGVVGQGVVNFGKWLGPLAPAILLSFLGKWLCNFMRRGNLFLRSCVVLVCLGTLPNFGRDITFFPMWPVIFGAIGVIAYERHSSSAARDTRRTQTGPGIPSN